MIRICKRLGRNPINDRLVGQVADITVSVGANSNIDSEAKFLIKEANEPKKILFPIIDKIE